jgi:hypothetical protein
MKFGMEILHKNVTRKYEIHENRFSDSHTLRKGANEFVFVLCVFFFTDLVDI